MSKVKMSDVLLERKWSGHEAGEVVTVEDYTAKSMVRKNYGRIITASERKKIESAKNRQVETAMLNPDSEDATITPDIDGKLKEDSKDKSEKGGN